MLERGVEQRGAGAVVVGLVAIAVAVRLAFDVSSLGSRTLAP